MASLASLPLAMGMALLLERNFPGRILVDALVHLPLAAPPVVVGLLLLLALGPSTPLGHFLESTLGLSFSFNWKGAALAAVVMGFPLMVRSIRLSLAAIDLGILAAARTLGAGPLRTFCHVIVPLSTPGLIGGFILGFARALGEFGATITFVGSIPGRTETLPLAIHAALSVPDGQDDAITLTLVALGLAFTGIASAHYLQDRLHRLGRCA